MSTQFKSTDTQKWWLGFGNGSDGDYSSAGNATDAPVDSSCSGSATSTSLSATNASFAAGKPVLIHQTRGTGAGNWELNQIQSYTSGTITLKEPLQNTYTDSGASQAQVIQLKQYNNFTQNAGHTLTAKAWDGNVGGIIAFLAKGTVTITGSLVSTGKGFLGGTTEYSAGGDSYFIGQQGESTAGSGSGSNNANANSGGGGGGDYSPGGGGGGAYATNATAGGGSIAGAAGAATGVAALTTLLTGGSGGKGAHWGADNLGGNGGNGGGIVLIIGKSLTISGAITTNGNNGNSGTGSANGDTRVGGSGGGGGAGGSILLKVVTATLGTALATATAGTGGGHVNSAGDGGAGSVGRIHLDYSGSYTGTTSPSLDATLDPTIKAKAGGGMLYSNFL